MMTWKRWLSILLAAVMAMSCCGALAEPLPAQAAQLTLKDIEAMNATAYIHDGRVTFVDGACTDEPVRSLEDAAGVVDAMLTLLGGDARTRFEPWRTLTDAAGNRYYVFQQMYAETTVPGGAVKVVADANGAMLGLVSSVESQLPDVKEAEGISSDGAEAVVLKHLADANQAAELVEGRTEKIILPLKLDVDPYDENDKGETRFVWAVYTGNPGSNLQNSSELPYLAHYVTMDGEYLYSLPTLLPGDEASTSGYNAAYVFEFMEPVDYTGTVTLSDGSAQEISLSLMRDARTGMFYLGNLERRIAVADCYEFIYNDGHVVLEASANNAGWDDTCLLSLYNYCRAWDYYRDIGWIGGDGKATPILILKDFCNSRHEPMDNACYAGKYYGWQTFLSSDINDFSQCLDVLGHEFTHCVTGSAMTYNAYMNDYGAINEAMSDIQGNICEMMMGATEDTTWLIAENSSHSAIRSMSDPHLYDQPEYTWDIYYAPNVKSPTDINDRGGVHGNSSLLNNVAWRLCEKGGMTLEEARAFWFAVDCAMVPGTDYAQLSELMPWVLKTQGMDGCMSALEAALDATRLRTNAIPETFDDDRALVTLTLPDGENFADGNWMLYIFTVDTDAIIQRVRDIFARRGDYAAMLDEVASLAGIDPALLPTEAEIAADPEHAWDRLGEEIARMLEEAGKASDDQAPDGDKSAALSAISDLLLRYFSDTFSSGMSAAGQDGRTARVVCRPGVTIPVLFRLELDSDMNAQSVGLAVYTFGTWTDLASILVPIIDAMSAEGTGTDDDTDAMPDDLSWITGLLGAGESSDSGNAQGDGLSALLTGTAGMFGLRLLKDMLFYTVKPGQVNEVPATGLENVATLKAEDHPALAEMLNLSAMMSGDEEEAAVDYGESEIYTQEDMDAAIALIRAEFDGWEGCALHSVRYAGDGCMCAENLAWLSELEGADYAQCIEFLSDFHSPAEGGGAWMPDREYTDWQWWLAREAGGGWKLISWGY